MTIGVFLSHPTPHLQCQVSFLSQAEQYLIEQGLSVQTLGRSSYDMDAPLAGIRRLMVGCCGLLCVAFRRSLARSLESRSGADIDGASPHIHPEVWLTSPYCQIEPAMAYQLGLPILVMKERGVLGEGVLERGVTGLYLPEFDCSQDIFRNANWTSVVQQWIGRVRHVYDGRGTPPSLL